VTEPCPNITEDCVSLDPRFIWIDPGWLSKLLILSTLPAFVAGEAVIRGFGRLGVSAVWVFMISMPLLVAAWFYGVGWLIRSQEI